MVGREAERLAQRRNRSPLVAEAPQTAPQVVPSPRITRIARCRGGKKTARRIQVGRGSRAQKLETPERGHRRGVVGAQPERPPGRVARAAIIGQTLARAGQAKPGGGIAGAPAQHLLVDPLRGVEVQRLLIGDPQVAEGRRVRGPEPDRPLKVPHRRVRHVGGQMETSEVGGGAPVARPGGQRAVERDQRLVVTLLQEVDDAEIVEHVGPARLAVEHGQQLPRGGRIVAGAGPGQAQLVAGGEIGRLPPYEGGEPIGRHAAEPALPQRCGEPWAVKDGRQRDQRSEREQQQPAPGSAGTRLRLDARRVYRRS